MNTAAWIGVVAGGVAIAGAMLGYAKFMIQAPLVADKAKLDAEKSQVEAARAPLERELDRERERLAGLDAKYWALQQDFVNLKLDKTGVLLKNEIDNDLLEAMDALEVTEGSLLVPAPPRNTSFVFLSIYGSAAATLRKAQFALDAGIVGLVYRTGTLHNTPDAYKDQDFFEGVDKKGQHKTRALLTIPLRRGAHVIGVMQFLNKPGGFTRADEIRGEDLAHQLAAKVAAFVRDPENFQLLGLAWRSEDKEATIAFCDLTSSAALFEMNIPSAVNCINEYLEQQCELAMKHGATVDKYLGDGVMLRFNVPRPIVDGDHAVHAVEAALEMRAAFGRLKEGWESSGLPVGRIYNRIGLCCGPVYETTIGHPQFQQITVIGKTVNHAAKLCENGARDRNVVIVDERLAERLGKRFELSEQQAEGVDGAQYEVIGQA